MTEPCPVCGNPMRPQDSVEGFDIETYVHIEPAENGHGAVFSSGYSITCCACGEDVWDYIIDNDGSTLAKIKAEIATADVEDTLLLVVQEILEEDM